MPRLPLPHRLPMLSALGLLVSLPLAAAEPPALDALLAALSEPAPATTAYFERRSSPLLAAPLHFGGQLSQPEPGQLIKTIEGDPSERLIIAGSRVLVEREGQPPRRFALKRSPELAALAASFEALLGGDRALLEQHYALTLSAAGAGWQIELQPRDARVAKKVLGMRLHGQGLDWRCFDLDLAEDESSRMWLGEWATAARAAADEATRDALCGGSVE